MKDYESRFIEALAERASEGVVVKSGEQIPCHLSWRNGAL
jgi:hypothetical protein